MVTLVTANFYALRCRMNKRLVGVNEKGLRVGQDHQRAKLTDRDVELIRQMRDEGMTYAHLAVVFEIGATTARYICTYQRRIQTVVKFKAAE